jgi:hypothetical protein
MPNGIFSPTLPLRLRTWWRRDRLDEQLAGGANPESSPALTLRARQLGSDAVRSQLANSIVAELGEAHAPNLGAFTRAGNDKRAEVREYADNLRALVARLRLDEPVDVQGAAMIARLVNDSASPLYRKGDESLGSLVLSARLALDRSASLDEDLPTAA